MRWGWSLKRWRDVCTSRWSITCSSHQAAEPMAFQLRPRESIATGLRRLARKELRVARDELRAKTPPGDEAIHSARKSIKKVRAVIDLLKADEGRGLKRSRKRLRDVSQTLSRLRDADATQEILSKLRERSPAALDEHAFARVKRRLSARKQELARAAVSDGIWSRLDGELRKLRRDVKRWRPAHRRFAALAEGIRAAYRDGRKAMARARERQRAEDFHEWRKKLKELRYQLRLVEGCSRDIRKVVRQIHRAEAWLGDDHNLVVLCAELTKDSSLCDLERLRPAADRYQRDLRRKVITTTSRMYSSTPNQYVRRVKRAWTAWRRQSGAQCKPVGRRTAA